MTEKGTKTLIGFFVMCALTLLIGGVMIVGSGSFSSAARFVCFFDASLRGCCPDRRSISGGVRVGKVVSIQINADADELTFRTPVVIELEKSALKSSHADLASLLSRGSADTSLLTDLVRKGLRARLGTLSFVTGQLSVDLDMLPDAPPPTPEQMRPYDGIIQIPTMPSSLDEMLNLVTDVPVRDIAGETLLALRRINGQLEGLNLPELAASLTELSRQATELARELTAQSRGLTEVREPRLSPPWNGTANLPRAWKKAHRIFPAWAFPPSDHGQSEAAGTGGFRAAGGIQPDHAGAAGRGRFH